MSVLSYIAPEFIKEGRLCWLRSPLYIVNNKGTNSYYFNDEEFNKVRKNIKGVVTRAKGLGEIDADILKDSMFNESKQRMDILNYEEEAINLLYELMGEDVEPRRNFIMNNVDFSEVKE